jgi:hypothetical protein
MSMRANRDRVLRQLGGEAGKVNNNHLFLVKDLEKKLERQYWVPVPGSVISMFVTGGHDWKYLGPSNSPAVKAKLAEIDKAQSNIVGEQAAIEVENFEVALDLEELGLGELPPIPEALEMDIDDLVPQSKGGRPKKSNEGDFES